MPPPEAKENQQVVLEMLDSRSTQGIPASARFLAPDFIYHAPWQSTPPMPRAEYLEWTATTHGALFEPGSTTRSIDHIIADDESVALQMTFRATLAATQERYENRAGMFFRLRDGLITEWYEYVDTLKNSGLVESIDR